METKLKLIKNESLDGKIWFQIIFDNMCLSSHLTESEAIKEFELVAERLKRGLPKSQTIRQVEIEID